MQVYAKQYINVKLKFRMNKNYHEKRKLIGTSWVQYITSCNTQSNAPEDG
jgi:hypothetical protein